MIRILIDLRRNTLQLILSESPVGQPRRQAVPAVLDIGEAGALIGIELQPGRDLALALPEGNLAAEADRHDAGYLGLAESSTPLARSASLTVDVLADEHGLIREITIPRRTESYEISFPSGNRCWRPRQAGTGQGQPVAWCSEVV